MKLSTGFTLIELLIVVAIIGILAAIAMPNFLNAQLRAQIARVDSEFRTIRTAFESYRIDENNYPDWSQGWANAWGRLTTPIAYMALRPVDVFQPKFTEQWVNDHRWYEFGVCRGREQMSTVLGMGGKFDNYVLASLGADRDDDTIQISQYPNAGKFLPYDVSNGLRSDGDILFESKARLNRVTGRP